MAILYSGGSTESIRSSAWTRPIDSIPEIECALQWPERSRNTPFRAIPSSPNRRRWPCWRPDRCSSRKTVRQKVRRARPDASCCRGNHSPRACSQTCHPWDRSRALLATPAAASETGPLVLSSWKAGAGAPTVSLICESYSCETYSCESWRSRVVPSSHGHHSHHSWARACVGSRQSALSSRYVNSSWS